MSEYAAPNGNVANIELGADYIAPSGDVANITLNERDIAGSVAWVQGTVAGSIGLEYFERPVAGVVRPALSGRIGLEYGHAKRQASPTVGIAGVIALEYAKQPRLAIVEPSPTGQLVLEYQELRRVIQTTLSVGGQVAVEKASESRLAKSLLKPGGSIGLEYNEQRRVAHSPAITMAGGIGLAYTHKSLAAKAVLKTTGEMGLYRGGGRIELRVFGGMQLAYVGNGARQINLEPTLRGDVGLGYYALCGLPSIDVQGQFGLEYVATSRKAVAPVQIAGGMALDYDAQIRRAQSVLKVTGAMQLSYDRPPVLTIPPRRYAAYPDQYLYAPEFYDDGQLVTVGASVFPDWLAWNGQELTGTPPHPTEAQPAYLVVIYAEDDVGQVTAHDFLLRVLSVYTAQPPSAAILQWMQRPVAGLAVAVKFQGISLDDSVIHYITAASQPVVTKPTDRLANWCFPELLIDMSPISQSASLEFKGARATWGSVTLWDDGRFTRYLLGNYTFQLELLEIWLGEQDWAFDEFFRLFIGVIGKDGLTSPSEGKIQVPLRDPTAALNEPILTDRYPAEISEGIPHPSADQLIPQCWGGNTENPIRNVEPKPVDNALHQYQVSSGEIVDVVRVTDNGMPVGFTKESGNNTFTLELAPYGEIRADVIGKRTGAEQPNTACAIVKQLVEEAGIAVHEEAFLVLDSANQGPVQLVVTDEMTRMEAIKLLLNSINAIHFMDGDGLFVMRSLIHQRSAYKDPETGEWLTQYTLTPDDVANSPEFLAPLPPLKSVTLEYDHNIAPNSTVAADLTLTPDQYQAVTEKHKTVTISTGANSLIKGVVADSPMPTRLLRHADAQYHAQTRADFRSVRRIPMRLKVISGLAGALHVGDAIQLDRFDTISAETAYVVYDSKFDALKRESNIEVVEVP